MKVNKLITLSIILLIVTTILVIITFSLVYWLTVKSNSNNYGMWQGCSNNGSICARWYDNGQALFQFQMTDAFKAFQGLQIIFLVVIFTTLVLLVTNTLFYPNSFWFYVCNCFGLFISNLCALASLLVFVINVYNSILHTLGWCYWMSVAVVGTNLIVLILVCIHSIRLSKKPKETSRQVLINNNNQRTDETLVNNSKTEPSNSTPSQVKSTKIHSNSHHHHQNTIDNKIRTSSKRYQHKHIHQQSKEQFQQGYSSEPEFIEYSLDRSWINENSNDTNQNKTLPVDFENKIESQMLNVKLPKLIYYDGADHYARDDFKKLSRNDN